MAEFPLNIKDLIFEKEHSTQGSDDNDFRFITSMVSHQLPFLDTVDQYDQSELVMTMVAHMFHKIIGKPGTDDQNKLRKEYIEYIEDFVNDDLDEEDQFCFLTSFVSHCLPFMDVETQPIFSELLTSMASHRPGSAQLEEDAVDTEVRETDFHVKFESRETASPLSRYSTDSSSLDRAEVEL